MKDFITIRIYFEYGQKIKHQSFWKRLHSSNFSTELMKRAKAFGLHQVLHLTVSKGYLNKQNIKWGIHEIPHYKHPHLIELIDTEFKINQFLKEQKEFLKETKIIIVRNQVIIN